MEKSEHDWRTKTLTHLEKKQWKTSDINSPLITRLTQLRDIPLNNFSTEDLRVMIGQQMSLDYLIPLALETLSVNLFAEGDLFEGDLLKNVLAIETDFWNAHKEYWQQLNDLIQNKREELKHIKFQTSKFDACTFKKDI